jgi:hypothetical protein
MAISFNPRELDEQYMLEGKNREDLVFVGAELKRLKRSCPNTRVFGQNVATSPFCSIANHDRSAAIWMFEHWREVLDRLEAETGQPPSDPFKQLASLDASHPAHIKCRVRASGHAPAPTRPATRGRTRGGAG